MVDEVRIFFVLAAVLDVRHETASESFCRKEGLNEKTLRSKQLNLAKRNLQKFPQKKIKRREWGRGRA